MELNKKITPGRWMGIIAFIHVLFSITLSQVIVILDLSMGTEYLYKLCALSFGVFTVVWGAIFGNGAIKKITKDTLEEI